MPREFRAAWVATVDNIDWPSKRGLPMERQQAELIRIFDRAVTLKLNAIVLQVRPAADAFYRSKLEPWSEYLTGVQGKDPGYDPLEFAVAEAHRRGLELHCWFNPYRARHPSAKGPLAPNHLFRTNPAVVKPYGKQLWMDPGEPIVQQRSRDVFLDVVRRYDIDGVHMDDYFYPYPENDAPFPDGNTFLKYGKGLTLADWRRKNVDDFVRTTYGEVHKIKPWVRFGISPFGVYRPGVPSTIAAGIDQYATLYADPLRWLREGWLDYIAPQLYWAIAQRPQSFPVLLDWWRSENVKGRHVWPGLYTSRLLPGEPRGGYSPTEIVRQIQLTRKVGPRATADAGHIHFSMKALSQNSGGVADTLRGKLYGDDALPPACPWLDNVPPKAPILIGMEWKDTDATDLPFRYVLWIKEGAQGRIAVRVMPGSVHGFPKSKTLRPLAVAAVDRCGNVSAPTYFSPGAQAP